MERPNRPKIVNFAIFLRQSKSGLYVWNNASTKESPSMNFISFLIITCVWLQQINQSIVQTQTPKVWSKCTRKWGEWSHRVCLMPSKFEMEVFFPQVYNTILCFEKKNHSRLVFIEISHKHEIISMSTQTWELW